MYSRVLINKGQLYKETSVVIEEPYVFYKHEGETYLTKPGKVYVEPWHPEFNYYVQNYDTAILGNIIVVGAQQNGDVEIYFDNPDEMTAIAVHYSLTRPFAHQALNFKDESLMSIRFNADRKAYLYKGYTTRDAQGRIPVGSVYVKPLNAHVFVYEGYEPGGNFMGSDEFSSVFVEGLTLVVDGDRYPVEECEYTHQNGYADIVLQGDPFLNSGVERLFSNE
jgi:hypothetical protein